MSLNKEIERIKTEIADISTKLLTGKTVEELVEEIFKERLAYCSKSLGQISLK